MEQAMSTRIVAIHGFLGHPTDWDELKAELHTLAPDVDFQTMDLFSKLAANRETSQKETSLPNGRNGSIARKRTDISSAIS